MSPTSSGAAPSSFPSPSKTPSGKYPSSHSSPGLMRKEYAVGYSARVVAAMALAASWVSYSCASTVERVEKARLRVGLRLCSEAAGVRGVAARVQGRIEGHHDSYVRGVRRDRSPAKHRSAAHEVAEDILDALATRQPVFVTVCGTPQGPHHRCARSHRNRSLERRHRARPDHLQ